MGSRPAVIDCVASQHSYARHLLPVVDALRARGHSVNVWATRSGRPWGPWHANRPMQGDLLLCASWVDARRYQRTRVVYLEHGAGQTYLDAPGDGYAGARGLEHVVLFVGPGEHVADRWRAIYPDTPAVSVGCPALDERYRPSGVCASRQRRSHPGPPLVAISSHWGGSVPECQGALPAYADAIGWLPDVKLIGHSHPRSAKRNADLWARLGIDFEPDPDVILRTADLLVIDNSSLAYEAAALGIPVLLLNLPTYRRDVEHGLRFWDWVPGLQCDEPPDLAASVQRALADPPEARTLRERATAHVYAYADRHCAERAADAIEKVL